MRRQRLLSTLIAFGLLTVPCRAESNHGKLWRVSSAILGAVTIADIHSTYGRPESNPLLRSSNGQFDTRGVAIKSLVVGSAVGIQWLLMRKNPKAAPYAAGVNFTAAALTGAVAVRNYRLK